MSGPWLVLLLVLSLLQLVLIAWWLFDRRSERAGILALTAARAELLTTMQAVTQRIDVLERSVRGDIDTSGRGARQEMTQTFAVFQQALLNQGAEPASDAPEAFAAIVRADVAKWAAIVRQTGAKPD